TDTKTLHYPDYYTQYYEEPRTNTAFGMSGWCEDYPSPVTFLKPLLYGPNVLPHANSNYSELNVPAVNTAIEDAESATGNAATTAWENANKLATEQAPWVTYRWGLVRELASTNMVNAYYHSYYENIDWVNA